MTESDVIVKRVREGLVVLCCDGQTSLELSIQRDLVRRSKHLTQNHLAMKADEKIAIGVTRDRLISWLEFVRINTCQGNLKALKTSDLVIVLKVSDYLDDQFSVELASALLASRLIATPELSADSTDANYRLNQYSTEFESMVAILQRLPEHLALATLRAVLAAAPPSEIQSDLADYLTFDLQDPHTSVLHRFQGTPPASVTLSLLLLHLPPPLRPIALTAASPSLRTDASLRLLLPSSRTVYDALLVASSQLPHVTSVTLLGYDYPPASMCRNRERPPEPMELLPQLPGLASLTIKYVIPTVPSDLFPALISSLPRLTQLTHLSLRRCLCHREFFSSLCRQFAALPQLLSLDLGEMRLGDVAYAFQTRCERTFENQMRDLAAGLKHLSALQSLDVEMNLLYDNGWRILVPTVAQLPLRSLNVSRCGITRWPQLPPDASCMTTPAFPSLERLIFMGYANIRNFDFQKAGLCDLERFPHLRELQLFMPNSNITERCFRALRDAPCRLDTFVVTHGELETTHVAQLVVECLRKWTGLQWLHLSIQDADGKLVPQILEPLQCLTRLRRLCLPKELKFEDYAPAVSRLTGLTCLCLQALHVGSVTAFANCLLASFQQLSLLQELQIERLMKPNNEVHNLREWLAGFHCGIAAAAASLTMLTKLVLASIPLQEDIACAYPAALKCLTRLEVLQLSGTEMGSSVMVSIAPVLLKLQQLQTLDLRWAAFGLPGARAMAQVLPQMKSLRDVAVGFSGKKSHDAALSDKAVSLIRAALPPGVVLFAARYDKEVNRERKLQQDWLFD